MFTTLIRSNNMPSQCGEGFTTQEEAETWILIKVNELIEAGADLEGYTFEIHPQYEGNFMDRILQIVEVNLKQHRPGPAEDEMERARR